MATNKNVRAEYDSLSDAANRFGQEAERIDKIAQNLARSEDSLRRNNWVGQGAEAFYKEMDGSVLPAFRRLEKALEESSQFIKQISKIFHDAEQEAAAIVGKLQQAAGSGGASGGAGGLGGIGAAIGGAFGGAFGGGGVGGAAGDAAGGALGGLGAALGGAFGGAGGAAAGGGGGDLASFPGTLQGLLQNAVQGMGLNPNGATLEIDIQKASGMPDTGNQYGIPNPAAGPGGGMGAGAGGPSPAASPLSQTPQSSGGGGSGGGDSGFGGGGSAYGGGSGLQMGGGTGQPSSPAYWFGATVGTPVTASNAASISPGAAPATPGGNSLGSLLAEIGATAGAAIVGAVGKSVLGKGLLH